jgi:osmotically-inducible protein OsmY
MPTAKAVRESVKAELDFDPFIDPTNITVKNLNGEVALNGTVPSYPQYREAAAAARRVYGVTGVHNHLLVVLPAVDRRDDAELAAAANSALDLNITVPDNVEASAVVDGNVWLTGTVSYGFERGAAEETIAGLTGVRGITNDIEIYNETEVANVTALVRGALDRYAIIPEDSEVAVDATNGSITLTGHVRTWSEHDAAINAAWMAPGVSDVRDGLVVTG